MEGGEQYRVEVDFIMTNKRPGWVSEEANGQDEFDVSKCESGEVLEWLDGAVACSR